jgi:hypothetical protein
VFDADPNDQLLAIGADAALTYFRWLPARRIEAEGNTARAALGTVPLWPRCRRGSVTIDRAGACARFGVKA